MIRKLLLAAMLAASLGGGLVLPATSVAEVYVQVAPPPPLRYEILPAARPGWVWVPGHWEWRRHRHVWIDGHWIRTRPGYRYYEPRWHQHDGRWQFERGRWGRGDRDGDGVPNRYDRRPDNPRRY